MSDNKILKRANELFEEIRTIRRDVHMHPELGYHENRTSALIKEEFSPIISEAIASRAFPFSPELKKLDKK